MCPSIQGYTDILDEAADNGTSGILVWALRPHSETGGFYFHSDGLSLAYHYPGFASNANYWEKSILDYIELTAYKMSGMTPIEIPIPDAPVLLGVSGGNISFRGSTGAYEYEIYSAPAQDGAYTLVKDKVNDCLYTAGQARPLLPIWKNASNTSGTWYKVKAVSKGGISDFSNAMQS
jgi:hypothetical protein